MEVIYAMGMAFWAVNFFMGFGLWMKYTVWAGPAIMVISACFFAFLLMTLLGRV